MTSSITSPGQKVKLWNCHNSISFCRTSWNKNCQNVWLKGHILDTPKFWFGFRFERLPKVENRSLFREFTKSLFVSDLKTRWQMMWNETILTTVTSSVTPQRDFEYCHLYSCLGEGTSCTASISRIVILFLAYMWLRKISRNTIFQDRLSNVKAPVLPCDLDTRTPVTRHFLGIKMKPKLRPCLIRPKLKLVSKSVAFV